MTPIAFNLTPRLKACLPGDTRYSTLLALYEALMEAAVFEMAAADIKAETVTNSDTWIEWGGGEQPVKDRAFVEVKYRDGEYPEYRLRSPGAARDFEWKHHSGNSDIIAYRVVKQEPQTDPDGWIPHKAGDPMPCDPSLVVEFRMRDGIEFNEYARNINWDTMPTAHSCEVTHWRPARIEK